MYTHILHATDLSEHHFVMCQQAADIARCFNAVLYLLHVIEPPPSLQLAQGLGFAEFDRPTTIKEDAQAVLATVGEAIGVPVEQQWVEIGSIKMHVLEKVTEHQCQLIILGRHIPTHLPAFLDSTAQAIMHEAKCDVMVLNSAK